MSKELSSNIVKADGIQFINMKQLKKKKVHGLTKKLSHHMHPPSPRTHTHTDKKYHIRPWELNAGLAGIQNPETI